MSYRDRIAGKPSDRKIEDHELRQCYRRVFGSADGQKVLDHIVQSICIVDAVVQYQTDVQAFTALERKNVGIMIARYAMEPTTSDQQKVEVIT